MTETGQYLVCIAAIVWSYERSSLVEFKSIDELDKLPRARRNEAAEMEVKQTANRPGHEKKSST